jgi:hypothetical protein
VCNCSVERLASLWYTLPIISYGGGREEELVDVFLQMKKSNIDGDAVAKILKRDIHQLEKLAEKRRNLQKIEIAHIVGYYCMHFLCGSN